MPFGNSFPVRAMGPKSDLAFAYVHADIGASGAPTIDATKTTAGFSITRSASTTGLYELTFPTCKFCMPIGHVRPNVLATVAEALKVVVDHDLDAGSGAVAFNTQSTDGTEAVEDPVSGSEIVFLIFLGY